MSTLRLTAGTTAHSRPRPEESALRNTRSDDVFAFFVPLLCGVSLAEASKSSGMFRISKGFEEIEGPSADSVTR